MSTDSSIRMVSAPGSSRSSTSSSGSTERDHNDYRSSIATRNTRYYPPLSLANASNGSQFGRRRSRSVQQRPVVQFERKLTAAGIYMTVTPPTPRPRSELSFSQPNPRRHSYSNVAGSGGPFVVRPTGGRRASSFSNSSSSSDSTRPIILPQRLTAPPPPKPTYMAFSPNTRRSSRDVEPVSNPEPIPVSNRAPPNINASPRSFTMPKLVSRPSISTRKQTKPRPKAHISSLQRLKPLNYRKTPSPIQASPVRARDYLPRPIPQPTPSPPPGPPRTGLRRSSSGSVWFKSRSYSPITALPAYDPAYAERFDPNALPQFRQGGFRAFATRSVHESERNKSWDEGDEKALMKQKGVERNAPGGLLGHLCNRWRWIIGGILVLAMIIILAIVAATLTQTSCQSSA